MDINIIYNGIIKPAVYDVESDLGGYTLTGTELTQDSVKTSDKNLVNIKKDLYGSDDTNISIEEVYNKIQLTCEIEEIEDLIRSPLDDETLYSPYNNKQHFCTEIISEGATKTPIRAFRDAILDKDNDYDKLHIIDWYIRTYKSSEWQFNGDAFVSEDGMYQCELLKQMESNSCYAAIIEAGKTQANSGRDNTQSGSISMSKYLVISVNGNGDHSKTGSYPNDGVLESRQPVAKYIGKMSGGLFSPIDAQTTNYIVISGDIVLNARTQITGSFPTLYRENGYIYEDKKYYKKTWKDPKLGEDDGGSYYTMKFYDNVYPGNPVYGDIVRQSDVQSIRPYNSDFSPKDLQYNYSEIGDETDKLLKLPVLACRLKIGDKYCVEYFKDDGSSEYKWVAENDLPEQYEDGEYVKIDYFTIGPNPKIEDYIIGQEYPLANSVKPEMNIDVEGIAIPVNFNDKLTGDVSFEILGPVNTVWNEITKKTKRKWIFWKKTTWSENLKNILAETGAIWIKDFEITIHSDNGNISRDDNDNDLIYESAENDAEYINIKDDIEFNISTALTSAECLEKGVKQTLKLNNPIINSTGQALRSIYNVYTGNEGKAENHYISNYWSEYNKPKILINSTLKDKDYDFTTQFKFSQFPDDEFFIQNSVQDLKLCKTEYTLKQR